MEGAREYAELFGFRSQVHGRLVLEVGKHARGRTFKIFVMAEGTCVTEVFNSGYVQLGGPAVCVYGITGGVPGWTETYGWLHQGPWQQDFAKLVEQTQKDRARWKQCCAEIERDKEAERTRQIAAVLASYKGETCPC